MDKENKYSQKASLEFVVWRTVNGMSNEHRYVIMISQIEAIQLNMPLHAWHLLHNTKLIIFKTKISYILRTAIYRLIFEHFFYLFYDLDSGLKILKHIFSTSCTCEFMVITVSFYFLILNCCNLFYVLFYRRLAFLAKMGIFVNIYVCFFDFNFSALF